MYGKRGRLLSVFMLCVFTAGLAAGCSRQISIRIDRGDGPGAQYAVTRPTEMWISVPEAQLVMVREAAGGAEQKILLPNDTVFDGDNFVFMRLVEPGLTSTPRRFELDAIVAAADGIPPPFTREDLRLMQSRSDGAGELVYARKTNGTETTCVLAFRGLEASERALPRRGDRLEIMMRNCVPGGEDAALAVLAPARLGVSRPQATASEAVATPLSPLARPYQ
ncbi:hypothetical protein [Citreimonas salinaria]|uniref:Lipoprotein n=1 Tax=Citreimonas salinaria TaxID=321339 RepID=A0A1H3MQF4_9RHOB|nr:hypothetical protein [Citreimonas salinaria]SDY78826.1 hypothetical protein SAMN05444340_11818 [Citreimonas salinaria]